MKRTTKYVGLDIHQASSVASVREDGGRVIARSVLSTEGPSLTEFIRGMRGAVHVTFEKGTQAHGVHELLVPRSIGWSCAIAGPGPPGEQGGSGRRR